MSGTAVIGPRRAWHGAQAWTSACWRFRSAGRDARLDASPTPKPL
jgi:hypothetical protein